ncbi:hypothetical protein METP2_00938 [Methanosarcinales archaeon]|nr:DUF6448 family protein [Candidatus Methanoperedens sp.]CAG0963338.1 hypothetical protein METP2_00938 [Methanosarcinales archaeon]
MKSKRYITSIVILSALFVVAGSNVASAHCDTMDGPVVKAARDALESGNVNLVLVWVQEKDANEIIATFNKTRDVRQLSPEAKELADYWFFETLVRLHRAGEGAPYTGLKPAGSEQSPAVPAADKALEDEKLNPLLKFLTDAIENGTTEQYNGVIERKNYDINDIEAGRDYVRHYVEYVHYVEWLYENATETSEGHY